MVCVGLVAESILYQAWGCCQNGLVMFCAISLNKSTAYQALLK